MIAAGFVTIFRATWSSFFLSSPATITGSVGRFSSLVQRNRDPRTVRIGGRQERSRLWPISTFYRPTTRAKFASRGARTGPRFVERDYIHTWLPFSRLLFLHRTFCPPLARPALYISRRSLKNRRTSSLPPRSDKLRFNACVFPRYRGKIFSFIYPIIGKPGALKCGSKVEFVRPGRK